MKIKIILIALLVVMLIPAILFADEKITLSTYYPAPYGDYDELTAYKMAIGPTYPVPTNDDDLVIEGNVGIGTSDPGERLEVVGGAIKATGGLIIETRTNDPAAPTDGQLWLRTDIGP